MKAVKANRRHLPGNTYPEAHQQLYAAGYLAGFDDVVRKMIEMSGEDSLPTDPEVLEQVSNRNQAYTDQPPIP